MKRLALSLAAVLALGVATAPTSVAQGHRGYGSFYGGQAYGRYAPGYGRGSQYGPTSFEASVARIMATHSRFRYRTHPRSLYNSPPHRYDYWGWGR